MRIVSTALAIALAIASGLALHFSRQADATRQRIAVLNAQLQQVRQEPAALPGVLPAEPATGPGADALVPLQDGDTPPGTPTSRASTAAARELARAQLASPEGRAHRRESGHEWMRTIYPDFDEALGIGPEETEKVLDLLVTHDERAARILDDARAAQDQAAARQQLSAAFDEHRRTSEREMAELLGPTYSQWQDYQLTRPAWQQRRDLRAVLEAAGTPLTEMQERSLIAALSGEQRSISLAIRAAPEPRSDNLSERYQRMLAAAVPHLSAEQLEGYRQMLDRTVARQEGMRAIFRESAAAVAEQERVTSGGAESTAD